MLSLKRLFALVFVCVLVEAFAMSVLPYHRYFPDLALVLLVYAALEQGALGGIRCGLWLGLLLDLMGLERFGMYTAIYGALGGGIGLLRGNVFTDSFISQSLIPAAAYLAVFGMEFSLLPADEPGGRLAEFWQALGASALWTTVLAAPLVFALASRLLHKRRIVQRNVYIP